MWEKRERIKLVQLPAEGGAKGRERKCVAFFFLFSLDYKCEKLKVDVLRTSIYHHAERLNCFLVAAKATVA